MFYCFKAKYPYQNDRRPRGIFSWLRYTICFIIVNTSQNRLFWWTFYFCFIVKLISFIRNSSDVSLGVPGRGLCFSEITHPWNFEGEFPRPELDDWQAAGCIPTPRRSARSADDAPGRKLFLLTVPLNLFFKLLYDISL